jgi:hypothetical protein
MAGASATKGGGHRASVRHGNWMKVTRTTDGAVSVTHKYSDEDSTVIEPYRVYHGDGGEKIDSRLVKGLVNRQVRE